MSLTLTPASVTSLSLSQTLNLNTIAVTNTVAATVPVTITAAGSQSADILEIFNSSGTKLVWVGSDGSLHMGGTTAQAASVAPPYQFDLPNQKIKSRGLLLGDIADTPDLGLRRAEGTDAAPTKITSATTISRIYWQGYGDNGPFAADFDTPTTGQHQAAFIGAAAQQDASYVATTVNGAVLSGATSLVVASATGLATTVDGGGQVYVMSAGGTYLSVSYTTLSGTTLSGCTGITANISDGANLYAFTRGTDLEFYTTPNGSDKNILRMQIDATGLVRFQRDNGNTALHIKSANTGIRMSAGTSAGSPEWMLTKVATSQWAIDSDDLTFRTTGGNQMLHLTSARSVVIGKVSLATNATDGFPYIPANAGAPTGVPTTQASFVPMYYDTTNHKLWVYDSGWKGVVLA